MKKKPTSQPQLDDQQIADFMSKVKSMEKGHDLDLSSDEDLSIAVMNLISIEEHLFFTAQKTGKPTYFDVLFEVREIRKQLMKQLIKDYEGEVWCTSKHLLAASMRCMEVGTKALTKGDQKLAADYFQKSYDLYNLFWGLNLDLISKKDVAQLSTKQKEVLVKYEEAEKPVSKNLLGKLSATISHALDCCRE